MGIGEILALVGVLIVAVGLVATWRRNGTEQAARDAAQALAVAERETTQAENMATWKQEIKDDIEHIDEELRSKDHGLEALSKGQADFRENCARLSTGLAGKVETNASNIKELKARKRGK